MWFSSTGELFGGSYLPGRDVMMRKMPKCLNSFDGGRPVLRESSELPPSSPSVSPCARLARSEDSGVWCGVSQGRPLPLCRWLLRGGGAHCELLWRQAGPVATWVSEGSSLLSILGRGVQRKHVSSRATQGSAVKYTLRFVV